MSETERIARVLYQSVIDQAKAKYGAELPAWEQFAEDGRDEYRTMARAVPKHYWLPQN